MSVRLTVCPSVAEDLSNRSSGITTTGPVVGVVLCYFLGGPQITQNIKIGYTAVHGKILLVKNISKNL